MSAGALSMPRVINVCPFQKMALKVVLLALTRIAEMLNHNLCKPHEWFHRWSSFWRKTGKLTSFAPMLQPLGFGSFSFSRFVPSVPPALRPWEGATIKRPSHLNFTIANVSLACLERKQICRVLFLYCLETNRRVSASLGLHIKIETSRASFQVSINSKRMLLKL